MHAARLICVVAAFAGLSACATQSAAVLTPAAVREAPQEYIVVAVANQPSNYFGAGSTARGYGGHASYLESAGARRTLQTLANDYHLQQVSGWPIPALALHCVIFKTRGGEDRPALIDQLRHDARVSLVQPLQSFTTNTTRSSEYNDPYAAMQGNLARMGVHETHQWSRGKDVRIAVIDTGVDTTHPDLQGRVAAQRNFVDGSNRQFIADRHGTAVAGVMAANANNSTGIVGIAPEAKLYALKACWQLQPDRDEAACNSFTLAQALAAAIELRVQIINLSLVGPDDPLLGALVARAQQAGIIVVGAADERAGFPARLDKVIGVAGLEENGSPTTALPVRAPDRDVLTLLPGGRYDFSSGYSIATAEISGAVALLLAGAGADTSLDVTRIRNALTQAGAEDKAAAVNICQALTRLSSRVNCGESAIRFSSAERDVTKHF